MDEVNKMQLLTNESADNTVRIVKAEAEDAVALTQISKRAFENDINYGAAEVSGPPGYDSVESTIECISSQIYYKILAGSRIIGGIYLAYGGGRNVWLSRIFIDPEYQNKGIGTKVMSLVEELHPGIKRWILTTPSTNRRNHHFYEKLGYEKIAEKDNQYIYIKRDKFSFGGDSSACCNFKNSELQHSSFVNIDLRKTEFVNADLAESDFNFTNMWKSEFVNVGLDESVFSCISLNNAYFEFASLGGTKFCNTVLGWDGEQKPISFTACNLEGCVIKNSNLAKMEITECNIAGMKIDGILVEDLIKAYNKLLFNKEESSD